MLSKIASALLAIGTLGSLSIHAKGLLEPAAVLSDGAVWALAFFALWMLYERWNRLKDAFAPLRLCVLAAVFAGVMTLGESFAALGTAEWVTGRPLSALAFFAGRMPLYFAGMRLLLDALSKPRMQTVKPFAAWKAGALLWLCWLPWYLCLFPGTVSNDSVSQMKILFGMAPLTNANPICQTGLVGLFMTVGNLIGGPDAGIALYCITQSVLMAWLLGSLLSEMEKSGSPRWIVWGSFAF